MPLPQLIYIAFTFAGLGIVMVKDGKPQGNYNFNHSLMGCTLGMGLLWWGGFFTPLFH